MSCESGKWLGKNREEVRPDSPTRRKPDSVLEGCSRSGICLLHLVGELNHSPVFLLPADENESRDPQSEYDSIGSMSDEPLRTGKFALCVDSYVASSVFAASRSRFRKAGRRIALFAVGPLAVALDLAVGFHQELYEEAGGVPGLVALALAIGVLLVALSLVADPVMIRSAARRRFRDGTFAAFSRPQTIEISTTGVRVAGGAGEGLTPWSSIVAVEADANAAYLFVNSLNAYIVPRHAFADVSGFVAFLAHAQSLCQGRSDASAS